MGTLGDNIKPKISEKSAYTFYCNYCDYGSCKKSNYNTHILSAKHNRVTNGYTKRQNSAKIQPELCNDNNFICECGKMYQHRQGLWRHKNKCSNKNNDNTILLNNTKNEPTDKELILMLIKENSELKNMMIKVIENGTNNTTNNNINNTNSHNKAFNLNFFLNETCKNAMNITDFVDSIKLQLSDLEKVGEIGYVEGISNIIIKNLNALDETERPVHCTDKKRETIYIKDEGQWEKDDDNKSKLKKSINKVANKNIKLISQFREKYPECRKCESSISDKYNKMIIEAMGGPGDNNVEKEDKIIRNIAKEITINK
jgi:hypothetical protein